MAIEVANRPDRLDHDLKLTRRRFQEGTSGDTEQVTLCAPNTAFADL